MKSEHAQAGLSFTAAATQAQNARAYQADAILCDPTMGTFAVANGHGAATSGRPGADLAIDTIRSAFRNGCSVEEAVAAANTQLFERSEIARTEFEHSQFPRTINPLWHGMAAAVVVARIHEGVATIAHVGDASAYLLRGERLVQLTLPHTLDDDCRRLGRRTDSVPKKVVMRLLGFRSTVECDTRIIPLAAGDLLILASDGLAKALLFDEIGEIALGARLSPPEVCAKLVESAVSLGESRRVADRDNLNSKNSGEGLQNGSPSFLRVVRHFARIWAGTVACLYRSYSAFPRAGAFGISLGFGQARWPALTDLVPHFPGHWADPIVVSPPSSSAPSSMSGLSSIAANTDSASGAHCARQTTWGTTV